MHKLVKGIDTLSERQLFQVMQTAFQVKVYLLTLLDIQEELAGMYGLFASMYRQEIPCAIQLYKEASGLEREAYQKILLIAGIVEDC